MKVLRRAKYGRYTIRLEELRTRDPPQVYTEQEIAFGRGFDIVITLDGEQIVRKHFDSRRDASRPWENYSRSLADRGGEL